MTVETEAFSGIGGGLLMATFLFELAEFGEPLRLGEELPFCLECVVIPVPVAIPSIPSVAKPATFAYDQRHTTMNAYNRF